MAAIITQNYRKNLAQLLESDISSVDNKYYIGLGKSDPWFEKLAVNQTAPFPLGTPDDCKDVLVNLTDLIKVTQGDLSRVIPAVNPLLSAAYYKKYDAYDPACLYPSTETIGSYTYDFKPAYMIEPTSGNVFLVIDSPAEPTQLSVNLSTPLGDFLTNGNNGSITIDGVGGDPYNVEMYTDSGYTLVCIGSINPNSRFNNEQFVEIGTDIVDTTYNYGGCVYGFHVADGGEGYSSSSTFVANVYGIDSNDAPYVTLEIPVDVSITDGVITDVKPKYQYFIDLSQNDLSDYNDSLVSEFNFKKAVVELVASGGSTPSTVATLYPCISNIRGFKYDITEYTPAWYVCFLANSRSSLHNVYTSYSQVSLIKNPIDESDAAITSPTKEMKKSFTLLSYDYTALGGLSNTGTYAIIQKDSGGNIVRRLGSVDSFELVGSDTVVYYTSSPKYGVDAPSLTSTHTVRFVDVSDDTEINTAKAPTSVSSPAVSQGEVLFIDNRPAIDRSEDQNEELKIIIQL